MTNPFITARETGTHACSVTKAALAAGSPTFNFPWDRATSSMRSVFQVPAGNTASAAKVIPDFLSSDGPDSRTTDALRNLESPSITTTASEAASLLISVTTLRSWSD